MIRWLINNSILILIYLAFIISGGIYLHGFLKYRGVESWPSVSAKIIGVDGDMISVPIQTRSGPSFTTMDSSSVVFQYSVEGTSYQNTTASPDGGRLPLNPFNHPWKAFYKPSAPDVAVLEPVPFQGIGLFMTAGFLGVFVLAHLWFTALAFFTKASK